jgi:cytochrome c553
MPWPVYKNLTDDDLRAVYAYLQSLAPVANKVPEPVIAEPPR